MDILKILRQFWPILKARVAALLATQIKALASRSGVTLTDEEALGLALLLVGFIGDLINQGSDGALVARASALLAEAQPV